jgi:hypothetical protein
MKLIYTGLESSGKSLALARKAEEILYRNASWLRKSGIDRPIVSNIEFSDEYKKIANALGITLHIWEDLDDLIKYSQCDVIIDEIGTYFDSRTWADLSLDVRRWCQQGAKAGIEIYGSAQDFAQVDISFRRLVNEVKQISKLLGSRRPSNTRPPIRFIWGLCLVWELDPRSYKSTEADMAVAWIFPTIFFIHKHDCELFDTTQLIKKSRPQPFKHIERICENNDCGYTHIFHK